MIDLIDVTAGYGNRPIIKNFSLRLERGDFVVLIGPNGAGKSTLLRVMAGLLPIDRGVRQIDGKDYASCSRRFLSQHVTYLPQDRHLSLPYTAREIVLFGAYARHGLWGTLRESEPLRAFEALKQVGAASFFDRPVTELSGGERQRVLLARTLLARGEIYLLDEPTAELDPVEEERVMHIFQELSRKGACVVMALHDLSLAARYGNQLVLLGKTGTIAAGPPAEVLAPDVLSRAYGVPLQVERSEGFIITEDKGNHPTKEEGIWE
ncbi:ABC transporter ATP-binding protein [uncultured Acidaminococcus sp.]|uniref:ABC transporter ATP-binding protein n=1 Tax=uncultured Acidaminococcus sp. TaxID=352152 RepID=UPI0025D8C6C0|nr:ABC transporter ATP-binding protein [uncultured Acidaminococcus sp.]